MLTIEDKLYRLSPLQLRAIFVLAKSKNGIVASTETSKEVGKKGKALGGVYSSLARQKFGNEHLIIPFGRSTTGHGLRWKLNEKLISKERLIKIVKEILSTYD